jgi:glycosyltransferase involved in cell wall biosynthesis
MTKLSVTVITLNEASQIRQCLESVSFADEIIVLDSGSTDNTVEIAKEYTDKVFVTDWPGFGMQKNRALAKATGEWVLSLDADEVVSEALQSEIQAILKNPKADGYYFKRHAFFCGKLIKFGDWRNDKVLRLFKRELGRFDDAPVHEKLTVNGPLKSLKSPLLHYTAQSLEEVLDKTNRYSSLGAAKKLANGGHGSLSGAILRSLFAFIRSYFIKFGFLDGRTGFVLAVLIAEGTYYRYLKMADFINRSANIETRHSSTVPNYPGSSIE